MPPIDDAARSTRPRPWLTLAVVAVGVFITALDNSIVNVALPSIRRDLDLGLAGIAWVVNGYVLSFAVLLLTGGRLADSFGRRRIFLIGLAGFSGASLLAGLAPSACMLIGARVLQGVGAALMTPPTLAIINHTFREPRSRATAIGIWGAVAALAFAVGPLLGGVITEHLHWTWVFLVNVPIGGVGLVAGARLIPESVERGASRRLDLAGLVVSAGGLFALTYALLEANDLGWGSPLIVGLLAAALAAGAAFIAIERRAAAPTVELSLFRSATFSGASIAILIFNLGTFGVFLFTSLYFQDVLGYSPVTAGSALLPWILMLVLIGPATGVLAERIAPRHLIAGGLTVMAGGLLLLTGIDEHSTYSSLLPGLVLGGIGGALTIPLNGVAIGAAPVEKSGVASGIFNAARETGGALGIAIIGAVVAGGQHHAASSGAAHAFSAAYARGVAVAAALALLAAIVALLTIRDEPMAAGETVVPVPEAA